MKPPTTVPITCPACGRPIPVHVHWASHRGGPTGHTATLQLDWEASTPALEQHLADDPDGHRDYLDSPDDDSASPDTSRAYFLDLLGRIDEVAS